MSDIWVGLDLHSYVLEYVVYLLINVVTASPAWYHEQNHKEAQDAEF